MAPVNSHNVNTKQYKMRKVKFSIRTADGFKEKEGVFHQFGLTNENDGNDGYYAVTCAIVEDDSGQVHSVYPACIQFLDSSSELEG